MHIFIQHDKNVKFFRNHIAGIYQVYTRFGNDKGIYLVYTWYIPGKTFQGFPDGRYEEFTASAAIFAAQPP